MSVRLRRAWIVLAMLLLGVSLALEASAEIYGWTDENGRLRFSQDIEAVPQAQREQAIRTAKQAKKHDLLQIYGTPSSGGEKSAPARRSTLQSGRTMRIPFEKHGTLMKVDVMLNDRVRAPFYIDTGASGVSIPWSISQKLGIRITDDTPRIRVTTANGVVAEPVIMLSSVQLGPARVENLKAAVSGSMDIGLLGGRFFNNYVYSVDSAAGVITLKPNVNVRGGLSPDQWRARFDEVRKPLDRLEAYLDGGGFTDMGRVRELEDHRDKLRANLEKLEHEANKHAVPRGWRE
jgi:clan AA aspartic protease (TIGR02281 family)